MPISPYIRQQLYPGLVRLRVTPDEPAEAPPLVPKQRRGPWRPHTAVTVAQVRHLFEHTDLTYAEIAARTGVTPGIITHWKRDGGWRRPAWAPRATDQVPCWRAGRRLRLRKLAARVEALARRCLRELEEAPQAEVEMQMQAVQVLKLARLEAMGRRGRGGIRTGPAVTGAWTLSRDAAIRIALTEMRSNAPSRSTSAAPSPQAQDRPRDSFGMVLPRSPCTPPSVRLRVEPDPPAITGQRPRGSRRHHTDAMVEKVRHMVEHTDLSFGQIAAKTGVHRASITLWARDGCWQRPPHAPRAPGLGGRRRASRRWKLRKLGIRLEALAERRVRELEDALRVEVEPLMQALQVLKMARLQAQGRRGRRHRHTDMVTSAEWRQARDNAIRTALKEMRRGGVDLHRAPKEALDMLIEANEPAEEHPALRERRSRRRW
ncbi:MAG: hypothetical protein QOH32_2803 [Bradyrhizobium sp.]|jgi:hypothetical protein|nr:hypothetical protein [Bradyrhizobium sp.]